MIQLYCKELMSMLLDKLKKEMYNICNSFKEDFKVYYY